MIELSLNEVETLATKVARAAGFSWGQADDISRAARVLASAGLHWPEALLALKSDWEGRIQVSSKPDDAMHIAKAVSGATELCPIRIAAWILDCEALDHAAVFRIEELALPIWLAALLADNVGGREIRLSWTSTEIAMGAGAFAASGEKLLALRADVTIRPAESSSAPREPQRRAFIARPTLDRLEALAARTYVPASENSRAKGAGGSRTDDE